MISVEDFVGEAAGGVPYLVAREHYFRQEDDMAYGRRLHSINHLAGVRARLVHLVREIAAGLEALHRVQFEEPWRPDRRRAMYGEW